MTALTLILALVLGTPLLPQSGPERQVVTAHVGGQR